jgi:type I restriction enzyme S subunit
MAAKKLNKTNVPNLRFKEFEGEWVERKLSEVTKKINSGKTPLGGESAYTNQGIPFIRSQNVNNNKLEIASVAFISNEMNEQMKNSIVNANDILLNITGASLGRSCVVPKDFKEGNVNQHVCIIRFNLEYNPRFVQPIFSSTKGQEIFVSLQTGSGREGLTFESIKGIKLKFPSKAEQDKIANFVSLLEDRIATQIKIIEELRLLKSALSKKIFTQQLRFKANNNFHDWEKVQIGNLVDDIHSGKNKTELHGNFSIYGSMGIIGYSTSYSYEGEYILVARVGANAGSIQLASGKFSVSDNTLVFYGLKGVDTLFFYHLLIELKLNRLAFGSGQPLITGGQLKRLVVFIPTQEEQIKIGNFLSTIDKKLDAERVLLQQLEKQKQYLLQNLFI